MQDDSSSTKAELLIKVQQLREQLIKERKISTEELERAIAKHHTLSDFISICSYCKIVRNNDNEWVPMEVYITEHADVQFSHGICPECYPKVLKVAGIIE